MILATFYYCYYLYFYYVGVIEWELITSCSSMLGTIIWESKYMIQSNRDENFYFSHQNGWIYWHGLVFVLSSAKFSDWYTWHSNLGYLQMSFFPSAFVRDGEALSGACVLALSWVCSSIEEFSQIFSFFMGYGAATWKVQIPRLGMWEGMLGKSPRIAVTQFSHV